MTLMKKKLNKKGFTLAELLIVVAIIAVLAAIAIPVFSSQLHKAKVATDQANCRALYADLQSKFLTDGKPSTYTGLSAATSFTLSDGQTITLNTGTVTTAVSDNGYTVTYADTNTGCSNCGGESWGISGS